MFEVKVEQGTQEWLSLRVGKITGTRLKEVLKKDNLPLIDEMIAEIGTGKQEEVFVSASMLRGVELESVARDIYMQKTGNKIEEVGFCLSFENDYLGLSPDGFTEDRTGAIEIKCPNTKNHVKYIRMGVIPSDYKPQVLMYFILNEKLEWLDFVSYDDRYEPKPVWIKRVTRAELIDEIINAKNEIDKFIIKLEKYFEAVNN